VDCDDVIRWTWEVLEAPAQPPEDLRGHLSACPPCAAEYAARRRLDQDLKDFRAEEQEEPSEAINRRVLSGLAERSTPGRGQPPHLGIVTPDAEAAMDAADRTPRLLATTRELSPLLALAAALIAVLLLGFSLGQATFQRPAVGEPPSSWNRYPRSHQVGLSERAIEALEVGSTYMLIGPRGGPYQVIDVATWDRAESVGPTVAGRDELVLAVGPAGGWSRGKTLLLGDLAGSGAEILARRALTH